jgi:hypothetical protein
MSVVTIEDRFTGAAGRLLVGRTVTQIVYAGRDDTRALGWSLRPALIVLTGGVVLTPSIDAEGNNAGAWFTNHDKLGVLPPLPLEEFIPRPRRGAPS